MATNSALNVLVWDENPKHAPKEVYPNGIRGAVADGLQAFDTSREFRVSTAHLDEARQGADEERLRDVDVLVWWGHARHDEVDDAVAEGVRDRCHRKGMGLVVLHSGHYSKPFRTTIEGQGHLKGGWRESTDTEEIRVCAPWHPIADGVSDFTLPHEEMYGSPFDVPPFETLVLQSRFSVGNETFPSGICWTVGDGIDRTFTSGPGGGKGQGHGKGRVFYFRPGHESFPTYFDDRVRRVLYNAVRWAGHRV